VQLHRHRPVRLRLADHTSWGLLAVASILVIYVSMCTPVTVNYLSECFTHNVEETAIVLNKARIAFGLSVAFYITPWVTAMGFGWTYGLMAFIMIVSWLFVMVLMWKGHQIRQIDPSGSSRPRRVSTSSAALSWWRTRLKLDLTFYCKFHVPGPVIVFLLPTILPHPRFRNIPVRTETMGSLDYA
jgi:MFS family permease